MAKEAAKDICRGNDFNRTSDVCRSLSMQVTSRAREQTEEKTV